MTESHDAPDEAATRAIGTALARALEPGVVVHLEGTLGAGKTTLARAMIRALAPHARVKSPTYTLVESYPETTPPIHHLDLYRIASADELEFLALDALADGRSVLLVEWPERGAGALPPADLRIELVVRGEGRIITIEPCSARGASLVAALRGRTETPSA